MLFIAILTSLILLFRDKYVKLVSYKSLLLISVLAYFSYLLLPSYELNLVVTSVYVENSLFAYIYFVCIVSALILLKDFQPDTKKLGFLSSDLFLLINSLFLFLIELSVPTSTSGSSKAEQLSNLSTSSSGISAALLPSLFCFSVVLGIFAGKAYFQNRAYIAFLVLSRSRTNTQSLRVVINKTSLLRTLLISCSFIIYFYGFYLVLAVFQQRASILTLLTILYGISLAAPNKYILRLRLPIFLLCYAVSVTLFSVLLILLKPLMTILFLPERDPSLEYIFTVISNRLNSLEYSDLLPLESAVSLLHLNASFTLDYYPSLYDMVIKIVSYFPFMSGLSPYFTEEIVTQYVSHSLWGIAFNGIADSYVIGGWLGILLISAIILLPLLFSRKSNSPTLQFILFVPLIYPAIRIFRNSIDFSVGLYRYGILYLSLSLLVYYTLSIILPSRTLLRNKL